MNLSLRFIVLIAVASAAALAATTQVRAQGCVAIRGMGSNIYELDGAGLRRGGWEFGLNYQHFRSYRHFVGSEEQEHRVEEGTEVINTTELFDLNLTYGFSNRISGTIVVPYFYSSRSSLYEHDRVNRGTTHGKGFGDVRLMGRMWWSDPELHRKGNVSFGVGLKMPTGNTNVKDVFDRPTGPQVRNVDQSIQPADGGWGVVLEFQGFQVLSDAWSLYASGSYLINPMSTNGTRTGQTNPITEFMSIPDQYQARAGVSWVALPHYGVSFSLGGRWEGVPSDDLIGDSNGYRRPGYVISVEPGVSWSDEKNSISLSVPWAVYRNRTRSTVDKATGRHGDAAFADYLISLSYTRRL